MYDGIDTREIIKNYALLKIEHKTSMADYKIQVKNLISENEKKTKRLDAAMKSLKK